MKIANTKGLTLLEMLIVLAIIGIVGVIGSYNWRHYTNNANLRTMARELQSDIAKAKQRAVSQGVCYRMKININPVNNYRIGSAGISSCAGLDSSFSFQPAKSPTSLGLAGAGIIIKQIDFGSSTVNFLTRGIIEAREVVVLENSRGSTATIESTVTGKTYVSYNMR